MVWWWHTCVTCLHFSLHVLQFTMIQAGEGRGLSTSWSPVQGVLPTVLDLVTEVKRKVSWRRPRPKLGCRATGKKRYRRRRISSYTFKFANSDAWIWIKIITDILISAYIFHYKLLKSAHKKLFDWHSYQCEICVYCCLVTRMQLTDVLKTWHSSDIWEWLQQIKNYEEIEFG
jgi:hypothetical protein